MGKNEPSKGTKESWTKLSTAFADSAAALDKAAQAKNKDAALEAHGQIQGSCMHATKNTARWAAAAREEGGGPPGAFPKGGPPPPPPGG